MKYTLEIIINKPRSKVIELFDNQDNIKKWQPGLQRFEHLSGDPGQEGAKSKLWYTMGGRDVEMIETITKRNLPDEFHGTYEAPNVFNIIKNRFVEIDSGTTKWIAENEFQMSGFMMKMMGLLMPGAFRKQSAYYLNLFKQFAESEE